MLTRYLKTLDWISDPFGIYQNLSEHIHFYGGIGDREKHCVTFAVCIFLLDHSFKVDEGTRNWAYQIQWRFLSYNRLWKLPRSESQPGKRQSSLHIQLSKIKFLLTESNYLVRNHRPRFRRSLKANFQKGFLALKLLSIHLLNTVSFPYWKVYLLHLSP